MQRLWFTHIRILARTSVVGCGVLGFFGPGFTLRVWRPTSVRDLVPQWTTRIEIEVTLGGQTASVFFNTDIEINLRV